MAERVATWAVIMMQARSGDTRLTAVRTSKPESMPSLMSIRATLGEASCKARSAASALSTTHGAYP